VNFYRTTPICICCGSELLPDCDGEDPTGAVCNSCFAESEAAMQKAKAFEALSDFRWMSKDWLRCDGCAGTGIRKDQHCYCRKGQALHLDESKRFAFVRGLPARAVLSTKCMVANGIDPDERIGR
jgi:hypothetical protein